MSLFRRRRYERKLKHYLKLPLCWALGHRYPTVTVNAGKPEQVVYTNGCSRCWADAPVNEERGLERRRVA